MTSYRYVEIIAFDKQKVMSNREPARGSSSAMTDYFATMFPDKIITAQLAGATATVPKSSKK